jgi:hypothetical protein
MSRTRLGREVTLEEAWRYQCRVEITFTDDIWGWPSSAGPLNPVRGYVSKSKGHGPNPIRIFLLIRQKNSNGGYEIRDDHIKSIREVRYRL